MLALSWECCPLVDNVYLDCCFGTLPEDFFPLLPLSTSLRPPTRKGASALRMEMKGMKGKNKEEGLGEEDTEEEASGEGDRSETSLEGSLLIPTGEDRECSAHSACAALALSGECCPSADNVYLDCCFSILPAGSVPTLEPSASPGPSGGPSDVPSLEPSAVNEERIDAPTLVPLVSPVPSDVPLP
jgi:hypothetical protein